MMLDGNPFDVSYGTICYPPMRDPAERTLLADGSWTDVTPVTHQELDK